MLSVILDFSIGKFSIYRQWDYTLHRFYIDIRFYNFHRKMTFHMANHIAVLSSQKDINTYQIRGNTWLHCCIDIGCYSSRRKYLRDRLRHMRFHDNLEIKIRLLYNSNENIILCNAYVVNNS